MTRKTVAAIILSLSFPLSAFAQSGTGHDSHHAVDIEVAQASNALVKGEVRKVDKDAKKITIRHGEIKNLGMPGMTMVFQVKDSAILDQVQPGDTVQFKAEKSGGAIVATEIQHSK